MPKSQIAIHILGDGRVVFGDLPPQLAEIAEVLAGSRQTADDSAIVERQPAGAGVEQQTPAARLSGDGGDRTTVAAVTDDRETGDPP